MKSRIIVHFTGQVKTQPMHHRKAQDFLCAVLSRYKVRRADIKARFQDRRRVVLDDQPSLAQVRPSKDANPADGAAERGLFHVFVEEQMMHTVQLAIIALPREAVLPSAVTTRKRPFDPALPATPTNQFLLLPMTLKATLIRTVLPRNATLARYHCEHPAGRRFEGNKACMGSSVKVHSVTPFHSERKSCRNPMQCSLRADDLII
jgi:hypothetical protein